MSLASLRPTLLGVVASALLAPVAALAEPDVALRAVTAPADAMTGNGVTLSINVENAGTTALTGYVLGVYLSTDNSISVFDRKLGEIPGPTLAVGGKATVSTTVTVPTGISLGTYSFGVIADPPNTLGERVATLLDNVRAGQPRTIIKAPSPDFVASKVEWGPSTAGGEVVPVRYGINNTGILDAQANVSLVLSTNETVTRSDLVVGSLRVDIAAGRSLDDVAWIKLPSGLAPARYFLGLWVDPAGEVAELSETNNLAVSTASTITSAALAVDTSWLPDAILGLPYVKSLVASGGDGPYEWRLVGGTLPEGMTISRTGLLTGTPTAIGTFSARFEVTSGSSSAQAAYQLRVSPPTGSLEVATALLPPAVVQTAYDAPLAAVGGTPPYVWRVAQGSLPTGLTIDGNRIKGTATKKGEIQSFQLEVRDQAGTLARRSISLRAVAAGDLGIVQLGLEDAKIKEPFEAKLEARGGAAPYRWTVAGGRLPKGLAFAEDGSGAAVVSGTPVESGVFTLDVRLEDGTGQVDHNGYVFYVSPGKANVLTLSVPEATRGIAYDEELTTDSLTPTWRVAGGELPPGFELSTDGHLRAIGGTVAENTPLRTYTFLVEVTDGEGTYAQAGLSLKVIALATDDGSSTGCASAPAGLLALVALAAAARRRRTLSLAALTLVLPVAAEAQVADYYVAQSPEANYPLLSSLWLDDVSLTTVDASGETPILVNGDFANTADALDAADGWSTLVGSASGLGAKSWLDCGYGGHALAPNAGPSLGCVYSFDGTTVANKVHEQFQLVQQQHWVAATLDLAGPGRIYNSAFKDVKGGPDGNLLTFSLTPGAALGVAQAGSDITVTYVPGVTTPAQVDLALRTARTAGNVQISITRAAAATSSKLSLADAVSYVPFSGGEGVAVEAGTAMRARYCLLGTAPGQTATITAVDGFGNNAGLVQSLALPVDQFGCETMDFVSTMRGPISLVISMGDPSAATTVMDFGTDLDDGQLGFNLPFAFPMFGTNNQAGKIGTNGMVAFAGNADNYTNQQFPNNSAPNGVIAPWWDDLRVKALPTTANAVPESFVHWRVTGEAPRRLFVAEWRSIYYTSLFSSSNDPGLTFQLVAGEDGTIEFHYKQPSATPTASYSASVGVESADGALGVNALSCNNRCTGTNFPGGQVLRFVKQSDLLAPAVAGPPVGYGDLDANFTATLRNAGSLAATGVTGRVYLSADTELDATRDRLIWSLGPVDLGRGQSRTFTAAVHLPADLPPGNYHPIVVVDPDNTVEEADENNNVRVGDPIRVGAPAPDFSVGTTTFSPAAADAGAPVELQVAVRNQGNRDGQCAWRVVLSLNDVMSLADRSIASGAVYLAAGATEQVSLTVPLPSDLTPGSYRLGVLVDTELPPATGVAEIDEFNNSARAATNLTVRGPLSIAVTELPRGAAGVAYSYHLRAVGGDGSYVWTLADGTKAPSGLTLSAFGDLEGIPTATGETTFTVQVASDQGQTARQSFTLSILPAGLPLTIVSSQLPAAIYGREYEAEISVTGGRRPYAFSVRAPSADEGLPPGVALDVNGRITGVPVASGSFHFVLEVADAAGAKATVELALEVMPSGRPVIDVASLKEALLGQAYEGKLAASGGTAPYKWSLAKVRRVGAGGVPSVDLEKVPGLDVAADGTVTGTPTEVGLYALFVRVEDDNTSVDQETLLLEVRSERRLVILTGTLPPATVGAEYDAPIVVVGGDEGLVTFSLAETAQPLPEGLTLSADGRVQGIATAPGLTSFVVRAADPSGRVDFRALAIEVRNPPAPRTASSGCSTGGVEALALLALLPLFLRRRRHLALQAAGALAVAATLALSGCGTPPERRACAGVSCQPGEQCDPADGICKCGGAGGRACMPEETCNPSSAQCELLNRCLTVSCTRNMTCDASDGACRCAGRTVCVENEVCDPVAQACVTTDRCAAVTCPAGLSCDPADGDCKCGGVVLAAGQRCADGAVVSDLCSSVSCSGGESCDPADGVCKCGGAGGPSCLYGQTCEPSVKRCTASSRCDGVRCAGGTSCDPTDGKCRCGGTGGEECSAGQTCDLTSFACVGGNRCLNKTCPANTECDPEDGECHCGAGGPVCGSGEACDGTVLPKSCRKLCDPTTQAPCSATDSCTYSPTARASYCGVAGTKAEGERCTQTSECGRAMHCFLRNGVSACRYYCSNINALCSGTNVTCRKITGVEFGACAQ